VKRTWLLGLGLAVAACNSDLPPANVVDGVRVLAISADQPYARPGESVSLQVLAADGRTDRSRPMQISWLPGPCMNPTGDDYVGCYPGFAAELPPHTDLSGVLPTGTGWTFTVPIDAIASAPPHPGAPDPYGIAFVFVAACAGRLEYVPVDPDTQSSLTTPFGCFDDSHAALGPDDFVFAFTRVYAFTDRRNANPVIDHVSFAGAPVDPGAGITVDRCTASDESNCPKTAVDTAVPDSSWEEDPGSLDPSGGVGHEAIWVDYYATGGRFANDSIVLFDVHSGRVSRTSDEWSAPLSPGPQTMWAVVHDTRGGTSWLSIPVNAR
jgi:hypothetical protein